MKRKLTLVLEMVNYEWCYVPPSNKAFGWAKKRIEELMALPKAEVVRRYKEFFEEL